MNKNQQIIELLLFYENKPLRITWLSRQLGISRANTEEEIEGMKLAYTDRGIQLVTLDDTVALVTHTKFDSFIQKLRDEQEATPLSKQALETLAIILFRKKVTKPEIDYIRGVNSVYILRNLRVRGLIDKKTNPSDKRSPFYIPTLDLLSFLGITHREELKDYLPLKQKLDSLHEEFIRESSPSEE